MESPIENKSSSLILGKSGNLKRALCDKLGRFVLFSITAIPTLAIVFMIFFIVIY